VSPGHRATLADLSDARHPPKARQGTPRRDDPPSVAARTTKRVRQGCEDTPATP
jgi:hypothetical protein